MEENRNDAAFTDESTGDFLHIKDITVTILRNIHWFLLCGLVGAVIAGFSVRQKERVYNANARIAIQSIINDNPIQAPTTQMNSLGSRRVVLNYTAINSEIFTLKSKTLMLDVVESLNLNVGYKYRSKVMHRDRDLYGESPLDVKFVDFNGNQYQNLTITPLSDSQYILAEGDYTPVTAAFGDTVMTSATSVVVDKTWFLSDTYMNTPISVSYRNVSDVADQYRSALSVTRNDQMDNVLMLSLNDKSPIRAAAVVNEVIKAYNDIAIDGKKRVIAETYDYINDRLASLDNDLLSKESEIASFKSANQILDTKSYGQEYLAGNIEASDEMEELQRELSLARYVREAAATTEDGTLPSGIGLGNSMVNTMIASYNENAKKLDKYTSTGNINNPVVRNLVDEQASQKSTITNMLDGYISTMEEKLRSAESYSDKMSTKLRQAPSQQVYIEGVERVQKIKESLYLNLLSKREELLISQPSIEGNARIIDEARVNRAPIAPNEKRETMAGFLFGLLIPIAIFFLISIFDTRVRFREDVEKVVSTPFLGEIPSNLLPGEKKKRLLFNSKKKKDKRKSGSRHHVDPPQIVVTNKRRDPISEAFRILRSNIEYVKDSDKKSNVFLMTSLLEGSGKSFISTNLSVCLALVGKKVVVVDCDLRKCTMTMQFSSLKKQGLTEYLSGQIQDLDSIITKNAIGDCVDAVFSGAMPPNPSELLSDAKFETMVDYLRERYDYIFLDSIPAGVLADATIIKKYADATLFIIRSGIIDRRMLPDIDKIYKSGQFPNMAVILNDVEYAKKSRYGYGYGFGHGYGQGYGYGYGRSYGYGGYGGKSYGNYEEVSDKSSKAKKS